MCAARSKPCKSRLIREMWERGELDEGMLTPEYLNALTPRELGMVGEMIAIDYFEERGYVLLEHGYHCSEGEADLVLFDEVDDLVVMAEVKCRRVSKLETSRIFPEEAVDIKKQRRYRRIAGCYLMEHYPVKAIRFDALGVTVRAGHVAEVEHIMDAFDWQVS